MALNLSNIDYSGEDINQMVQEMFLETAFVNRFGARVEQGVKSKYVYHDLADNISLQAYEVCPSSPTGTATITQVSRELCEFMMPAEFENDKLLATYLQSQYGRGSRGNKIAGTQVMRMIVDRFVAKSREQWDDLVLNGDKTYGIGHLNLCNGLLSQFQADASVVDITAGSVTAANVEDELNKVWNAIDKRLKYTTDPERRVKIAASINIVDAWVQAQTALGAQNPGAAPTEAGSVFYRGIELVPLENMPDDTMFATPPSNITLVYDDDSDFGRFNVTDLSATDALCDKTTMKMVARGDVFYGIGKYVTLYS